MKFTRLDTAFIAILIPLMIALPVNGLRLIALFILALLWLALKFDNHTGSLFMIALAFSIVLLILTTLVGVIALVSFAY